MLRNIELPEEPQQLAAWLDRELCGDRLHEVVADLERLSAPPERQAHSLSEVFDPPTLDRILTVGLQAASADQLHDLLDSPRQLWDLRAKVLELGGDFWTAAAVSQYPPEQLEASWEKLQSAIKALPVAPSVGVAAAYLATTASPSRASRRAVWPWLVTTATAALVFLGIFMWQRPHSDRHPAWGWQRDDVLAAHQTDQDYLNQLAAALEHDWKERSKSNPRELSLRLTELKSGCSRQQKRLEDRIAEGRDSLTNLTLAKRLLKRCQKWEVRIDSLKKDVDASNSVETTLKSADAMIADFCNALRAGLPEPTPKS